MLGGNLTLREYQQHLFDRLHATVGMEESSSHLGFEAGDWTWVVPLRDISEVVPVPQMVPVPLAVDWLTGVVNVRGSLFTVTDLGRFANARPTAITPESRLVVLHGRYRAHAALLVRRSLGLCQARTSARGEPEIAYWQSATNIGSEQDVCRELNVRYLVRDARFLRVALHSKDAFCGGPTNAAVPSQENL